MKVYFYYIAIPLIAVIFSLCTSYNSDKANYNLIQGRWMLVDVNHALRIYDTIAIDYKKDQTFLFFDGNECSQFMPDLRDTSHFQFSIHDYELELSRDGNIVNILNISLLTPDSLKFEHETGERVYIRVNQQVTHYHQFFLHIFHHVM